jgi:hypothetical protein
MACFEAVLVENTHRIVGGKISKIFCNFYMKLDDLHPSCLFLCKNLYYSLEFFTFDRSYVCCAKIYIEFMGFNCIEFILIWDEFLFMSI